MQSDQVDSLESLRLSITTVRDQHGVELTQLAREAGVAYGTLLGISRGTTTAPRPQTVRRVERAVHRLSVGRRSRAVPPKRQPQEDAAVAPVAATETPSPKREPMEQEDGTITTLAPVPAAGLAETPPIESPLQKLLESFSFAPDTASPDIGAEELVAQFERASLAFVLREAARLKALRQAMRSGFERA